MPFRLSRIARLLAWWESSLVRVSAAVLLVLVGYVVLFVFFTRSYADRVVEFRRQELKRLVQLGLSSIEPLRQSQREGILSLEQARALGRAAIQQMTFSDETENNYLFMGSYDGEVPAATPDGLPREGAGSFDLVDAQGVNITQELIKAAKGPAGEGYVEYSYPPPGRVAPQRKISYVVGIPEWDSYIGAGMVLGDIEARTQSYVQNALVLTFGLVVLVFLAIFMVLQPTARSYRTLLRLFDSVSHNPDDLPAVPVDQFRPGSEGWQLMSGFQAMLERLRRSRHKLQDNERELEKRVAERTRELSTLLQVSHDVASTLELQPLLGLILDQLKSLIDYTSACVFVLEDGDLVAIDYRGPAPREAVVSWRLGRRSPVGEVLRLQAPVIVADVRGEHRLARLFREAAGERLAAHFDHAACWMSIPLMVQERPIGALGLEHSQVGFYTAQHASVAMAVANQAAIAIENARLYEQGQQLAALQERQRLARELHDSVSQALYGIALGARTARTLLGRDAQPSPLKTSLEQPLDYVLSLAEAGLAEMRALIFELRPESLDSEGLVAALTKQADWVRTRHNIPVGAVFCDEPRMPFDCKEALYRIAQEALNNVVKHAKATRIDLRLLCSEEGIVLEVEDDGQRFDPAGAYPGHLGLRSMRERIERLGGALVIVSAPGRGACVRAEVKCRAVGAGRAL